MFFYTEIPDFPLSIMLILEPHRQTHSLKSTLETLQGPWNSTAHHLQWAGSIPLCHFADLGGSSLPGRAPMEQVTSPGAWRAQNSSARSPSRLMPSTPHTHPRCLQDLSAPADLAHQHPDSWPGLHTPSRNRRRSPAWAVGCLFWPYAQASSRT